VVERSDTTGSRSARGIDPEGVAARLEEGLAMASTYLSATARPGVRQYIANQEEHHHMRSSWDELLEMLAKAGIEYDERYFE